MTTKELVALHQEEFYKIARDKTHQGDPGKRADQLTDALRHTLCCWILVEASERELLEITGFYGTDKTQKPRKEPSDETTNEP